MTWMIWVLAISVAINIALVIVVVLVARSNVQRDDLIRDLQAALEHDGDGAADWRNMTL